MANATAAGREDRSRTRAVSGWTAPFLFALTANSGTAFAQTAPASDAAAAVDDIVVYARKRGAESVQDVPLAISAYGQEKLEAVHAINLESISYLTPNVSLDGIGFPGIANFAIRGLGANSSIPSLDPTVGVFVDGVYLGTTTGVVTDFFDLDGIEILRGPQGVLFGKNVTGGAVLLRTRRPGDVLRVRGKVSIESGPQYTGAASIDMPITSNLAAGLTGYIRDDKGYFRDTTLRTHDYGKDRSWFVRPALNFTGDRIQAYASFLYEKQDGDGVVNQNVAVTGGRKNTVASNIPGFSHIVVKQGTAEVNVDVGPGDGVITNIFGYRDTHAAQLNDSDGTASTIFHLGSRTDAEQFSNELRYAGKALDDKLAITTGLYYFTQDLTYREQRTFGVVQTAFGGDQQSTSYGAFVNGDLSFADTLTASAGIRYTREKKRAKIAPQISPVTLPSRCDYATDFCTFTFADRRATGGWTPRLNLQWQPDRDILAYATWSRGFRSGGYNLRHTTAATPPRATNDESLNSYEVGLKLEGVDRRLKTNMAIFRTNIKNILRDTVFFDPATNGTIQLNQNAGNAHIYGVELESSFSVTDHFSVSANVGYLHGKYDKLLLDISGDAVINQLDYKLILPRLAKWTYSVAGNYDVDIGKSGIVSLRSDFSYRSRAPYSDANLGFLRASDILNASVKWTPLDKGFTVSIYGRNLLNDQTEGVAQPAAYGFFRFIKKGRVLGAEATIDF